MFTFVDEATADVVTVNDALVAPALTVTVPGAVATPLLLDSVTEAALEGAALNVTVP
jgi:hypothetical protein